MWSVCVFVVLGGACYAVSLLGCCGGRLLLRYAVSWFWGRLLRRFAVTPFWGAPCYAVMLLRCFGGALLRRYAVTLFWGPLVLPFRRYTGLLVSGCLVTPFRCFLAFLSPPPLYVGLRGASPSMVVLDSFIACSHSHGSPVVSSRLPYYVRASRTAAW